MSNELGNLLAVIHSDGAHYQAEHGTEKAVRDAIKKWGNCITQLDEYRQMEGEISAVKAAERERCIEACRVVMRGFMDVRDKYQMTDKDIAKMYERKASAASVCIMVIRAIKDES